LVDHAAIDDPAFNGICRAAEDIGGVRRAEFVRRRAVQGREHLPDIREMLGARN
jgi:hypothetical protein